MGAGQYRCCGRTCGVSMQHEGPKQGAQEHAATVRPGGRWPRPSTQLDTQSKPAPLRVHPQVPCTFAFLGIRNETAGSVHALHNPR